MSDVAFLTGASSGLGRALALRLAGRGYALGLAARRRERLEEVAAEIRAAGGEAEALPCDVSEREDVLAAVARCGERLGPPALLVANAGVSENTDVRQLDGREVERVMRVNFLGAVWAVEAVLPGMLERGRGHLVGVSSLAGFGGLPLTSAYSASKAALSNFFEGLRIDLRDSGVDVTVIHPGYVRTPMTERNRFPMPFLMELDDAVDRMERAIVERRRSVAFPWPLAALARVGRLFPRGLYDRVAGGMQRSKEPERSDS